MSVLSSNLVRDIRSLPPPVWVLVCGQFINRFGSFVFPFLTLILSERDLAPLQISIVLGAMSAGHFMGPVAGGYLADAIGRRNTIVASLVGSSLSLAGLYFCRGPLLIALVAAVHGFLTFLFGPASSALLTDLVPEEKRLTAFALWRLAINGGFAAGPAVAGLLFMHAPALVFFGDALTTLVFALIAWRWLPHGLRTISGKTTSPRVAWQSWIAALADMRGNLPFLQFLFVVVFVGIAFNQVFNVLALTATDRGLSPSAYGRIMGLNGLVIVLLELPLTSWVRRYPVRRILATGYALIGLGCAVFGIARSSTGFALGMLVFTTGEILALPLGMAYSSNLAPRDLRGRYFGFRGMAWAVAGLFGSLGVWTYGQWGQWLWLFVAGSTAVAAIGILPAMPERRRVDSLGPASLVKGS